MDSMENKIYKCSFCDKPEGPNRKLIGNPEGNSFICEECVSLCRDILRGKGKRAPDRKYVDRNKKCLSDGSCADGNNPSGNRGHSGGNAIE